MENQDYGMKIWLSARLGASHADHVIAKLAENYISEEEIGLGLTKADLLSIGLTEFESNGVLLNDFEWDQLRFEWIEKVISGLPEKFDEFAREKVRAALISAVKDGFVVDEQHLHNLEVNDFYRLDIPVAARLWLSNYYLNKSRDSILNPIEGSALRYTSHSTGISNLEQAPSAPSADFPDTRQVDQIQSPHVPNRTASFGIDSSVRMLILVGETGVTDTSSSHLQSIKIEMPELFSSHPLSIQVRAMVPLIFLFED
jgi:hypothetical protein